MPERSNGHNNGRPETPNPLIHLPNGSAVLIESSPASAKGRNGREASPSVPSREVQFTQLQGGGLLDLVRKPSGRLALLIYRNGKAEVLEHFTDGEVALVPPKPDQSLVEAVRWPPFFADSDDTPRQLLDEMKDVFRKYIDMEDRDHDLVANFCLYSWFGDAGIVAPYLWVIGPYSSGKTTLLRLMSALCRRAVRASDVTPAAFYSLCEALRPTLLLDELELDSTARGRDLGRLLRSGSTQGPKVLRAGKAYDPFGPRVIVSRQEPSDAALSSRNVVVTLRHSSRCLPPLDETALNAIALRLQPRLLAFRLRHYSQGQSSKPVANDLTPRMKDIARALAIPLLGDAELESAVTELLRPQDTEAKLKRTSDPEWVVATALYRMSHCGANYWTALEIACEANDVLAGYGEPYRLEARRVGDILRVLHFPTEKLGNRGRGLRVTQDLCRLIHRTAKQLGLCRADILDPENVLDGYGGYRCDLCVEVGLWLDNLGNALRESSLARGGRTESTLFK
jgi:hypothetical protein